jgi:hypothetical protein
MKRWLLFLFCAALLCGGELRFVLRGEPKTLDPWMVADEFSEAVRYLTEGVLIRINRLTQKPEPELAASWKISKDGTSGHLPASAGCEIPEWRGVHLARCRGHLPAIPRSRSALAHR